MKKIVRLTENDLHKIVTRVINEDRLKNPEVRKTYVPDPKGRIVKQSQNDLINVIKNLPKASKLIDDLLRNAGLKFEDVNYLKQQTMQGKKNKNLRDNFIKFATKAGMVLVLANLLWNIWTYSINDYYPNPKDKNLDNIYKEVISLSREVGIEPQPYKKMMSSDVSYDEKIDDVYNRLEKIRAKISTKRNNDRLQRKFRSIIKDLDMLNEDY